MTKISLGETLQRKGLIVLGEKIKKALNCKGGKLNILSFFKLIFFVFRPIYIFCSSITSNSSGHIQDQKIYLVSTIPLKIDKDKNVDEKIKIKMLTRIVKCSFFYF